MKKDAFEEFLGSLPDRYSFKWLLTLVSFLRSKRPVVGTITEISITMVPQKEKEGIPKYDYQAIIKGTDGKGAFKITAGHKQICSWEIWPS